MPNCQISVTNQFMRWVALLQFFMYKFISRRQRIAIQVRWCGYLHRVDQLQTYRFLSPEFEITIECLYTSSNSNMELIRILTLQPIWLTTKESVQMQISSDKWLITSTRIFYKTSSASLDCISISEVSSTTDNTVAAVHENVTSLH